MRQVPLLVSGTAVVHGEHPVLIAGEVGELPRVLPDPLIGGVEQVRPVAVDLDAGLGFRLGVGVPAEVRAALKHEHTLAELGCRPLGDRQTEKAGADDEEVKTSGGHQRQGYLT